MTATTHDHADTRSIDKALAINDTVAPFKLYLIARFVDYIFKEYLKTQQLLFDDLSEQNNYFLSGVHFVRHAENNTREEKSRKWV